jgi:hypothetical protein
MQNQAHPKDVLNVVNGEEIQMVLNLLCLLNRRICEDFNNSIISQTSPMAGISQQLNIE